MADEFAKAIENDDSTQVQRLIASGAVDVNAHLWAVGGGSATTPPLVLAARLGHAATASVLLRAGARLDLADAGGDTACSAAVSAGHFDVLTALIAHGAQRDAPWRSPLEVALDNDNDSQQVRIAATLIKAGAPLVARERLCRAAATSVDVIQALLYRDRDRTVFAELLDGDLRTPLHLAATIRETEPKLLRMLVDVCGIKLDAVDYTGSTCTHVAALHGNDAVLRWFIEAGADLEAVEEEHGHTPLLEASSGIGDDAQSVRLLLAAGADASARSRRGQTACRMAAEPHRCLKEDTVMAVIHALLAGGSVDEPDRVGMTARQLLAIRGRAIDDDQIESARRDIAKLRLDFVRHRALQVCIGLQSRGLDALQMCEILVHACGPLAHLVPFHQWWKIATTVKHFAFSE